MSPSGEPSDGRRPWWSSAGDGERVSHDDHHHDHHHDEPAATSGDTVDACQVCPICALVRAVGETRPDLVVHLSEAARHLTMAAKVVVDAHAAGFGGGGLQHIPLDEDEPAAGDGPPHGASPADDARGPA